MNYSPILALATGVFEGAAVIWASRRQCPRKIKVPVLWLLGLLAGYQFMEAVACAWPSTSLIGRLALFNVLWLPPLGVLLTRRIWGRPSRCADVLVGLVFLGAAGIGAIVLFHPGFIRETVCQVVFANFKTSAYGWYQVYGAYYNAMLFLIVFWGLFSIPALPDLGGRRIMADFVGGNVAFAFFALFTLVVFPDALGSAPSILCHYALLLALSLIRIMSRFPGPAAPEMNVQEVGPMAE